MDLFSSQGLARLDGTEWCEPVAAWSRSRRRKGRRHQGGRARASYHHCTPVQSVHSASGNWTHKCVHTLYTNNNNIIIFCKINFFVRFSPSLWWINRMYVTQCLCQRNWVALRRALNSKPAEQ